MTDSRTTLRHFASKWHEVPGSRLDRVSTTTLLGMTDEQLLGYWEQARAETSDGLRGLGLRGWYHALYGPWVSGRKILEVGPGLGIDAVAFALAGASMTLADVSETNLEVVRRISALKGLPEPHLLHLRDFEDLETLDSDYDAVFAFGSLHHIPADVAKPEFDMLANCLKPGGRFVMHAYPFQRWVDDGQMPFDQWGQLTDGAGTPWAEWYDTRKLIAQLRPARFAAVLYCEYRDGVMNAIDLMKIDSLASFGGASLPADAREVVGAICLRELSHQPHWSSSTTKVERGSIVVTTPSQLWAYAASLPIHQDRVPSGGTRCILKVRATVSAGRVGVAIASADGSAILTEEYLAEDNVQQECVLEFMRASPAASVIVRNASSRHGSSTVLVHSMDLFCLP